MTSTRKSFSAAFAACALLSTIAGCGGEGRDPQWPETHKVTGVVTLNGEPVEWAMVGFSPVAGGKAARGNTDADGRYELRTYFSPDFDDIGAVQGEYKVTLYATGDLEGGVPAKTKKTKEQKPKDPNDPASVAAAQAANDAAKQYARGPQGGPPKPKSGLPIEYATDLDTPLKVTVEPTDDNVFNFDLAYP